MAIVSFIDVVAFAHSFPECCGRYMTDQFKRNFQAQMQRNKFVVFFKRYIISKRYLMQGNIFMLMSNAEIYI